LRTLDTIAVFCKVVVTWY